MKKAFREDVLALKREFLEKFSVCFPLVCLGLTSVLLGGCVGMPFKSSEVTFINPYQQLNVIPVEPNEKEKAGVKLRLKPAYRQAQKFREETTLYARIKKGKGLQMQLVMDRADKYALTDRKGIYRLSSETLIRGGRGKLFEEKELNERGEIVKFIRGDHRSKIGTFRIIRWDRRPVYPEHPVKIGERWNYEEVLEVRLKSAWVKEANPQPFQILAMSTLKGFAMVKGKRCAIIETSTRQFRREHLKLFLKELIFNIESEIQQTTFLDYETGSVVATIAQIHGRTIGLNTPMEDVGQSQSISYVVT